MIPPVPEPRRTARDSGFAKLLLILFLTGSVVGGAGGLVDIALGGGREDHLFGPSLLPQRLVLLAIFGLSNAGCAVGTWSFKRWGVYGLLCTSLVAFVVNWKIGGAPVALPGLIAAGGTTLFAGLTWLEFD